jgi:hypothetical protein
MTVPGIHKWYKACMGDRGRLGRERLSRRVLGDSKKEYFLNPKPTTLNPVP